MFHLLVPALVLGVAASQSANTTEQPEEVLKNQTLTVYANKHSPTEPNNMTAELQDELQRNRSSVLSEDDEDFQDRETRIPYQNCNRPLQLEYSHFYCGRNFQAEMENIDAGDWCVLENIIRPYNDLTVCLERLTSLVDCYFPNPDIQDFFLHIHSIYFHNCTEEEEVLPEVATSLVVALTIIPVSLIPVLIYPLLWKR
ncbi:receptor activity-modifying protein 3 [Austrofundulus limnaeus]|uniref:Receptor activity-modifying protein 3 n=1 Tax=Austrofundulus limnaeus TaxID=52670 RepID=A0A2I4BRD1_AUSLI|nr:PREDICTED: receptor activity-modifying protein 3-like [Austrofundulus limnaeus]